MKSRPDHTEGIELDEEEVSDLELGESSLQIEQPQPEVEIIPLQGEGSAPEQEAEVRVPEPEPEPEPEIASVDKPVLEDIDPEILEIFTEEAQEELEAIREYLPQWQRDQNNREALNTFRRSFHTLKGSGRLVGAKVIGELAWAVENMLNRLIDETIKVNPDMMDLLNRVVDSLPELISCQERGVYPDIDVEFIQRQAYALAEGKPMPTADAEPLIDTDTQPSEIVEDALSEASSLVAQDEQAEVEAADSGTESEQEFETLLDDLSSLEIDTDRSDFFRSRF